MRFFLFLLIALSAVACRKELPHQYLFGETENVLIYSDEKMVQALPETDYQEESLALDLDYDGTEDIRFISWFDSIPYPENEAAWGIRLKIVNPDFFIYEIPASGIYYEVYSEQVYDYYGTYPRCTQPLKYACDANGTSADSTHGRNWPYYFEYRDVLDFENYNWTNRISELVLYNSGHFEEQNSFNEDLDSIFSLAITDARVCHNPPLNEVFYLAFRKNTVNGPQVGWIEAMISDKNKLSIARTAISAEELEYSF